MGYAHRFYPESFHQRTSHMAETTIDMRCPRCGRDFVRRVRPHGIREHILHFFHIYPFQCQVCLRHFTLHQTGARYTNQETDRRHYERLTVHIPVTFVGETVRGEGVFTDLSMGGGFLQTRTGLTLGTTLRLVLEPGESARMILIERAVVRRVHPGGVGLQFLHLQTREQERLSRLVHTLLITHRV